MKNKNFVSRTYNLSRSVKEWRFVALLEAVLLISLMGVVVYQSQNTPVRLIPQSDPLKEYMTGVNSIDSQYLQIISTSDILMYANWTPHIVKRQISDLTTRISPKTFNSYRPALIKKSNEWEKAGVTQSFMLGGLTSYNDGNVILVEGTVERTMTGEILFSGPRFYAVVYDIQLGVPMIEAIYERNTKEEIMKVISDQ